MSMELPNPFTPLAFIPPADAKLFLVVCYASASCLSVIIWDIMNFFVADCRILFVQKYHWKKIAFGIARITPFFFFLLFTIFLTSDEMDCESLYRGWQIIYVLVRASTSLLLYFRVCAAYNNNRFILLAFGSGWLLVVGITAAAMYKGSHSYHIGPTKYCATGNTGPYITLASFIEFFVDALTCLAIVYRLGGDTWKERIDLCKRLLRSNSDRRYIAERFVHDTIGYTLLTALVNGCLIIAFFVISRHSAPESAVRAVPGLPASVIDNLLALRVYRKMKLGEPGLMMETTPGTVVLSGIAFAEGHRSTQESHNLELASKTGTVGDVEVKEAVTDKGSTKIIEKDLYNSRISV